MSDSVGGLENLGIISLVGRHSSSCVFSFVKDLPLEGDESSIIVVTGGRPGPSSHCSLSNHQFKIKQ